MSGTQVRTCSCNNPFQDEKYGKGLRLMNVTLKGYRCTVCSKEFMGHGDKSSPLKDIKGKKKK